MADTDETVLSESAIPVAEVKEATNASTVTDVDEKGTLATVEPKVPISDNDVIEKENTDTSTKTMANPPATATIENATDSTKSISPPPSRKGSKDKGSGTPPRSSIFMHRPFLSPARFSVLPVDKSIPTIKEGTLYKQRDVFKGWRPRHFVLKGTILHYFLEEGNADPKRSLDLRGCTVSQTNLTRVNDTDYFVFIITQTTQTRSYVIAATTKEEADAWVDVLSIAAATERTSDGEGRNVSVGGEVGDVKDEASMVNNVSDDKDQLGDTIEGAVSFVNAPHSPLRHSPSAAISNRKNGKSLPFPTLDEVPPAVSPYFNPDRSVKYGFGAIRLLVIMLLSFAFHPATDTAVSVVEKVSLKFPSTALEYLVVNNTALKSYVTSYRFLGHAYIGSIGALVNVEAGGKGLALFVLALAAFVCFYDSIKFGDISMLIYLMKTFSGDYLAGKIDTEAWKAVFFFVFGVFAPCLIYFESSVFDVNVYSHVEEYQRILLAMFFVQFVCELGDAQLENATGIGVIFRHRYSFEILTLGLLFCLPNLTNTEQFVIQIDLVACLFYRLSNYLTVLIMDLDFSSLNMLCLQGVGVATGIPFVRVTDPEIATAVLRQCTSKGRGLEHFIACPAWRPILSLESVGGSLWRDMKRDFMSILKKIESADNKAAPLLADGAFDVERAMATTLKEITARKVREIFWRIENMDARSDNEKSRHPAMIEANTIVRLTLEIFIFFVFGREWHKDFEILIDASWEFRKGLAVRGEGDMKIKKKAVKVVVGDLIKNSYLWELYGEKWKEPRYYSLILQPFLISPAINVGDIMCSVAINGPSCDYDLETCMRMQHPFPILERYAQADITLNNDVVIKKGTHVIMFTSDFTNSKYNWPLFGAGPRACAGGHLALPVLKVLMTELVRHPLFNPLRNHKHSGRHLDGKAFSFSESLYFIETVLNVYLRAIMGNDSVKESSHSNNSSNNGSDKSGDDEGVINVENELMEQTIDTTNTNKGDENDNESKTKAEPE